MSPIIQIRRKLNARRRHHPREARTRPSAERIMLSAGLRTTLRPVLGCRSTVRPKKRVYNYGFAAKNATLHYRHLHGAHDRLHTSLGRGDGSVFYASSRSATVQRFIPAADGRLRPRAATSDRATARYFEFLIGIVCGTLNPRGCHGIVQVDECRLRTHRCARDESEARQRSIRSNFRDPSGRRLRQPIVKVRRQPANDGLLCFFIPMMSHRSARS